MNPLNNITMSYIQISKAELNTLIIGLQMQQEAYAQQLGSMESAGIKSPDLKAQYQKKLKEITELKLKMEPVEITQKVRVFNPQNN
jgi:hypothetical protein